MAADGTVDPAELEPLLAAVRASTGDARATIEEALDRMRSAVPLPPDAPGFASHDLAVTDEIPEPWADAAVRLDEEVAPAAVTGWFEQAVDADADVGLGNYAVGWVDLYEGVFRPDLDGLFAQYRRAALAETRPPGTWFLGGPGPDGWHGFRVICLQIGWTVSRGGLRGLVPGLARPLADADETERAIAALLIADAAAFAHGAAPPIFSGGGTDWYLVSAPADETAILSGLLREAALVGVVPDDTRSHDVLPNEPEALPASAESAAVEAPAAPTAPAAPAAPKSRPRALGWGALAALAVGGLAVAKWVFGWLTLVTEAELQRLDAVQCTVFAPPAASPGDTVLVQVFAHLPEAAADARAIATELDVGAVRRAFRSLDAPVPIGGRLDFELRVPGLEVDEPVASLTWQGGTEAVQFGVSVPAATPPRAVIGTVSISREGIPLGHVKFSLAIHVGAAAGSEPQGLEARRYRLAFVSYASQDRDEVLRRVQMLSLVGLRYFQDVIDLEPGEIWSERLEQAIRDADVFLLFWSSRAKQSEWVRREVDFALACQRGEDVSPPEIRPVIIEGPPVIPPWEDLAHLHFNDRVLYFMSRPG